MKRLGVYIHIPFCARKCSYCDFYSLAGKNQLMQKYQQALLHHIKESASQLSGYYIDTIYFGGGTPSFYGADRLIEIFDSLKQNGKVLLSSEVTLEANPDSIKKADLVKLRKAGFNRISIGVQSADDEILKKIGRLHNFASAQEAVVNAHLAGFKNVSVDLMYGLPSQSKEGWADTINKIMALKPDHISCYGLKVAEGTELYVLKDTPFLPDDDTQADMYLYAVETLARYGFEQYEISNFAKKGYESRHNLKYWTGQEYIGFGAAAHSYIGGVRYGNIADMDKYIEGILNGGAVVESIEKIDMFERAGEYLMLGLRTTHGICAEEYRKIYPADFEPIEEKLKICEKYGWAVNNSGRWYFTPRGFLLSNVLIGQVLDARSEQSSSQSRPWREDETVNERRQPTLISENEEDSALFHGI
jgi:putative oxygen-independent coproporphyrinogen III oxidase